MNKFQRRDFLKKASAVATAGTMGYLVGCNSEPTSQATPVSIAEKDVNIQTEQHFEWKIVTTWSPTLPILMDGVRMMAEQIEIMSQGRLKIEVFGGGELVGPLEAFDAVSQGTAEMGHGASYYWAGKIAASQFFTSVPFGMNTQQMYAWVFAGGALALWEEAYGDVNLIPMPAGNTGVQMGGWFNKEINSVADFQGLKMRMPGLGGKAIAGVGASAELLPGSEIYTSLERGVIDATEWIGPYHDEIMGFQKVAKYYYYPGWHEPGSLLELIVNRQAFESLPADLQLIVRTVADAQNPWMLAQFDSRNFDALRRLVDDDGVDLRPFPDDVMDALRISSLQVVNEVAAGDPMSKKVWESFSKFQENVAKWGVVSEKAFYNSIQKSTI
jgi:TRAP-type mannitol/chloroaromatic compound transport system substrate-binding protein